MWSEAILALTNVSLLSLLYLERRSSAKERSRLVSAVLARSPQEFGIMTKMADPRPARQAKPKTEMDEIRHRHAPVGL